MSVSLVKPSGSGCKRLETSKRCTPRYGSYQAIHATYLILERGRRPPPSKELCNPNGYYSGNRRSIANHSVLSGGNGTTDDMGNINRSGAHSRPPRQSHSSAGLFHRHDLHRPAHVGPIFRSALHVESVSP